MMAQQWKPELHLKHTHTHVHVHVLLQAIMEVKEWPISLEKQRSVQTHTSPCQLLFTQTQTHQPQVRFVEKLRLSGNSWCLKPGGLDTLVWRVKRNSNIPLFVPRNLTVTMSSFLRQMNFSFQVLKEILESFFLITCTFFPSKAHCKASIRQHIYNSFKPL